MSEGPGGSLCPLPGVPSVSPPCPLGVPVPGLQRSYGRHRSPQVTPQGPQEAPGVAPGVQVGVASVGVASMGVAAVGVPREGVVWMGVSLPWAWPLWVCPSGRGLTCSRPQAPLLARTRRIARSALLKSAPYSSCCRRAGSGTPGKTGKVGKKREKLGKYGKRWERDTGTPGKATQEPWEKLGKAMGFLGKGPRNTGKRLGKALGFLGKARVG